MSDYFIYVIVLILLAISAVLDKKKTKKALKIGLKSFKNLLPTLIPMMLFIGVILSILSPDNISLILGERSGIFGIIAGLIVGSVAFLPSFVAFPLGASLLEHGAGYPQIAAFVSTLMAVGVASIALEIQYFGKKMAVHRNILAMFASIMFTVIVWGVM